MKDAMTYAHEAGFFSFNVVGWKIEFERLIASIRAEYEVPLKLAEEALQHYRIKWAGEDTTPAHTRKALSAIREALAEPVQEHESREDIAAKEMFEGFSKAWAAPVKQELNWGANKFMLHEQPVKQEPVFNADDLYSIAGRLALELECLLMDTKDMSVVSKWWDSAHEALEQWRSFHSAPVQPVKQEPVIPAFLRRPGSFSHE